MAGWTSYVAVGDSFTEGMDDPRPDGKGYRGWADLVAGCLATDQADFRYANLAVRGRLFDNIVAVEQVPLATAMKPDLISFAGGGNDALRRGFEPECWSRGSTRRSAAPGDRRQRGSCSAGPT